MEAGLERFIQSTRFGNTEVYDILSTVYVGIQRCVVFGHDVVHEG